MLNRIAAEKTLDRQKHEAICSLRDVADWLREQGEEEMASDADMLADQIDNAFIAK